jgi:hypothetical protein
LDVFLRFIPSDDDLNLFHPRPLFNLNLTTQLTHKP